MLINHGNSNEIIYRVYFGLQTHAELINKK